MELNEKLKRYLKEGKSLIKDKPHEILFSENTYEVEIKDGKNTFWPFLQLEDDGKIIDAFCSCKSEEEGLCPHIAAAFLLIFQEKPLHIKFKNSFWKTLFEIQGKRLEFDLQSLKKRKDGSYYNDGFLIYPKSPKKKKEITALFSQKQPLEGSLKFSALSFDEIGALRSGKTPMSLRFELSAFSDLAKKCFLEQEMGKPYKIDFTPEENIPTKVTINFKDLKIEADLDEADLSLIIPTLKTVKAPLNLLDLESNSIKSIVYDRDSVCFKIEVKKEILEELAKLREEKSLFVDNWYFIPKKGFLAKSDSPFFQKGVISRDEIAENLTLHGPLFAEYLEEKVCLEPEKAKYDLFIDDEKRLHVDLYVFEKGDLSWPKAVFFNPWVFIEKGFFLLKDLVFNTKEKVIPFEKVSEFIGQYRGFLQNIEGFEPHFGTFQENLTYSITESGDLKFDTEIVLPEGIESVIDFGNWVYIKNKGFYSKKERGSFPINPSTYVSRSQVDDFITSQKEDLKQIPNFFTKYDPIKKIGVDIGINEKNLIEVTPEILLQEGYEHKNLFFFDKYVYVKNQGFFELPFYFKVPVEYSKKKQIDPANEEFFINYEIDRLKSFIVSIDPRLQKPEKLHLQLNDIIKDKNSYLVELEYISEFGSISACNLWKEIMKGEKMVFSPAGLLVLKDARFNWLKEVNPKRVLEKRNMLRLNFLQWLRLLVFEDIKKPKGQGKKIKKAIEVYEELIRLSSDMPLDISKLKAQLWPYQEIGVKWLWFLYTYGLSGLLCDEMGLGKTHQAMALLAAASKEKHKYLVVCPTSVIYHWQELLNKFLPDFKVCVYHGLERGIALDYDVLVTSYGIIRSEIKTLESINFEIAIFDETQIAKNHASKTNKALRRISSKMRLGLTGTPIENRLRELESLFDLILPNYLPSEAVFRHFFILPIEKEKNKERKKLLSKLIKPFIMRRKKQEVLLELPEKMEEISYCDLSDMQRELYNKTALASRDTLIDELKNKAKAPNYLHVFALLSKLKQICDHPVLINKDLENYQKYQSGKWDLFIELLNEARESNQKVVVFSQYLDMISIITRYLKKQNIGYASIIGSTKDRQEQIKKFKEDPKCEIFVASLLAAGVGINLSVASIVIHYDRWWNPAKENQATDRVHRIGQTRGVQVLKLVTKNTIEERIHALIEQKKGLIEETIGKDESDQIKILSREELIAVLQEMKIEK